MGKKKILAKAAPVKRKRKKSKPKCKRGFYKGIWCDSTWELAWVIYYLDNNIPFERNTKKFEYLHKKKIHNYIPDFIVDGHYIEIKGWASPQWESKLRAFPHKIRVLYADEIEFFINYVKETYKVESLEKLYDKV